MEVIGVTLDGGWAGSVDKDSTRIIDPSGIDQPPPLPWVAVLTDAQGNELGSLLVQAGTNQAVTVGGGDSFETVASMRPGCSSTPDPYAGLPSNACGGFHLKIVNNTSAMVTVALNGAWTTTVDGDASQVINQMFSQPHPPMLPWYVVIKDVDGRSVFEGIAGDTSADQKVTLTDGGAPIQTPYDLHEGC